MVHRFWEGMLRGGYVGHGETYLDPGDVLWWANYLVYFGNRQPSRAEMALPEGRSYRLELIDAWDMSVRALDPVITGPSVVPLPGKPYVALRLRAVAG